MDKYAEFVKLAEVKGCLSALSDLGIIKVASVSDFNKLCEDVCNSLDNDYTIEKIANEAEDFLKNKAKASANFIKALMKDKSVKKGIYFDEFECPERKEYGRSIIKNINLERALKSELNLDSTVNQYRKLDQESKNAHLSALLDSSVSTGRLTKIKNWIKKNPWKSGGIGAGVLSSGGLGYYLLNKNKKNR